jgi:hypothetical protein
LTKTAQTYTPPVNNAELSIEIAYNFPCQESYAYLGVDLCDFLLDPHLTEEQTKTVLRARKCFVRGSQLADPS